MVQAVIYTYTNIAPMGSAIFTHRQITSFATI